MAFFAGHLSTQQQTPLAKLPLNIVRRILTQYKVAQGRRTWFGMVLLVVPSKDVNKINFFAKKNKISFPPPPPSTPHKPNVTCA
jgi:hypothetical protein